MRFDVVTLFPELFAPFVASGVTRRAYQQGALDLHLWQLRDFAEGNYRRVDERPFGGGPGMVLMAEPLARCVEAIRSERGDDAAVPAPVVLFSPAGETLRQAAVERWAASAGAILICGRYEGVDQRFIDAFVDAQISLGDFVLSGGEIAALTLLDAVARLQPGVLHDARSAAEDSFGSAFAGQLDSPQYTRPPVWRTQAAPPVLLSGNHAEIARWHAQARATLTAAARPDLLAAAPSANPGKGERG